MVLQSKTTLVGQDHETGVSLNEVAIAALFGCAIGLGTGGLIWMVVVVHFGLMGCLRP